MISINSQGISYVASICLHLLVAGALCLVHKPVPEIPKVMKVTLAPPKPEPPKIEQPKPEPPKPKPEPPKPEPPKPEPPKPKPEPPKPEPPKPKPEPPKPKPEQPRKRTLAERLNDSQVVTKDPPAPQPRRTKPASNLAQQLKQIYSQNDSKTAVSQPSDAQLTGVVMKESNDYAEQVVNPFIKKHWIQPVKGELDVANVTPVEISFIVYASGTVSGVRIITQSNSRVMNESVRKFLENFRRLPPLSQVGSKATNLKITVTISLSN